jgi:hypothetical protein
LLQVVSVVRHASNGGYAGIEKIVPWRGKVRALALKPLVSAGFARVTDLFGSGRNTAFLAGVNDHSALPALRGPEMVDGSSGLGENSH